MKTKSEILEKVSEIIDTSKDEQIVLNASNFLYHALNQIEFEKKSKREREESREKMKPLGEILKTLTEV